MYSLFRYLEVENPEKQRIPSCLDILEQRTRRSNVFLVQISWSREPRGAMYSLFRYLGVENSEEQCIPCLDILEQKTRRSNVFLVQISWSRKPGGATYFLFRYLGVENPEEQCIPSCHPTTGVNRAEGQFSITTNLKAGNTI